MAHEKNHNRKWEILRFIEEGKPIDEIEPKLNEEEMKFYRLEKWDYEETLKLLPKGAPKPHFVPADDADMEW